MTSTPENHGESEIILTRFAARSAHRIELDLERMPVLLQRLGRPLQRLAPVVHIAGTNGKGSTLAFLAAMLEAAGKRVQRFTSPYLVRVTEEVRLVHGEIADDHLAALLRRVEDASEDLGITAFEALAAAAFLAFAEEDADFLLLETGMGGRLDVTNVVPHPALTLITPIAMDHMAFLGRTITAIATEKAGILKPGTPCIADPEHPDAVAVVTQRARDLAVSLRLAGIDFNVVPATRTYSGAQTFDLPESGLKGPHQMRNTALAVAAMEALLPDSLPAVLSGLAEVHWPARMQLLTDRDQEVWVDGGHNVHAATAMAEALEALPPKPLVLIVGMLDNRPLDPFLHKFAALEPLVIGVPIDQRPVYAVGESMTPELIAARARQLGFSAIHAANAEDALATLAERQPEARVLVTGSLYLAGRLAGL